MSKLSRKYVKAALEVADGEQSKISQREKENFGLSSSRLRCFINNIAAVDNINFLEIGTYRGATALAAAYGNKKTKVYTVDNFKYDDREPKKWAPEDTIWENVKSQLESNIERYKDPNSGVNTDNIKLITGNFEDIDWSKLPKFDICFFDVSPVLDETYDLFFTKTIKAMAPESVIIFTNYSNEKHAEQLNQAFKDYENVVDIQWQEQRISGGLSDATKYYSGIAVVGIKKKADKVAPVKRGTNE